MPEVDKPKKDKEWRMDTLGTSQDSNLTLEPIISPPPLPPLSPAPPIPPKIFQYKYFPPLVGNLKFVHQVKARIESNMKRLDFTQRM